MTQTIKMAGVGKRYRLGEDAPGKSLREALSRSVRSIGKRPSHSCIWSLKDIDLTVADGDALGVIGRNGAGKSTMLKILARITEPTEGVSRTRGRVASLLEVGTGFHSELTGRENVYLNGAILGMTKRDIRRRFDAIVDFAGVESFLDTPIKRYSSGMHLRLAFAVAAHLEPDILLVDEILAVGDAEFQRKCLKRMADVEQEGRTVVFVSHDLEAIGRLCNRGIWIEHGRIVAAGSIGEAITAYLSSVGSGEPARAVRGDSALSLARVQIKDELGHPALVLRRDRPFTIELEFELTRRVPSFDLAVYVVNSVGQSILDEAWSDTAETRVEGPGRYVARVAIPPVLNVGDFRVGVWAGSVYEELLNDPLTARFSLEGSAKGRPGRAVELLVPWDVAVQTEPAHGPREP